MSDVSILEVGSQSAPMMNMTSPEALSHVVEDVEEAPEPVKEPEKEEDEGKWAQRFAVLSKRERELQKKTKELKFAQENDDYKAYLAAKQSRNPIQALQSLGMSFQDAAQFVLNDQKHPEPTVEDQIKELKAQIAKQEEDRTSREQKAKEDYIQQTIDNHKAEIGKYIQSNSDKYELIAANDAQDTVYEVIEEYYNKFDKLIGIEEASQKVEDWLTERARSLFKLKKFQTQTSEQSVTPSEPVAQSRPPQPDIRPKIGMTLTNNAVSSQPARENLGLLTREESIKRAAAMLRYK
jgi:hypothetical protein